MKDLERVERVTFPCVCGAECFVAVSDDVVDSSHGDPAEPAAFHPVPACDLYMQLDLEDWIRICRKKLGIVAPWDREEDS